MSAQSSRLAAAILLVKTLTAVCGVKKINDVLYVNAGAFHFTFASCDFLFRYCWFALYTEIGLFHFQLPKGLNVEHASSLAVKWHLFFHADVS